MLFKHLSDRNLVSGKLINKSSHGIIELTLTLGYLISQGMDQL